MTNLTDNERVIENFQLCVNSARSIGCPIQSKPEDLAAGKDKAIDEVSWALVKVHLLSFFLSASFIAHSLLNI